MREDCLLKGNILPHAYTFSFITLSETNDGNSSYFSRCELLGWLSACFWSLEPEKISFSEIALWCTNNANLISCLEWTQSIPVSSQVCCRLWKNRKHAPFFCRFHQDPCEWNILTSCFHEKYYRSQSCQRQRMEWASQGARQEHADSMFWYIQPVSGWELWRPFMLIPLSGDLFALAVSRNKLQQDMRKQVVICMHS